jgi:hypothetical protein
MPAPSKPDITHCFGMPLIEDLEFLVKEVMTDSDKISMVNQKYEPNLYI